MTSIRAISYHFLCYLALLTLVILFWAALHIRDGVSGWVDILALTIPVVVAALTLRGVQWTIRQNRQAKWWEKAEWALDRILDHGEREVDLKAALIMLDGLWESEDPTLEDSQLLSKMMEGIYFDLEDRYR